MYDSEEGIGGRSEGLAEFANKTASSAWELENKIAGISNESNVCRWTIGGQITLRVKRCL